MANLSSDQVKEAIKNPTNKNLLNSSIKHEERLRFHVEPSIDSLELGNAYRNFLTNYASFLPADKFTKFKALISTPLITNELCEAIFTELHRVFDAQNAFIKYEFKDSETEDDFVRYREQINDHTFWKVEGFEAMKTAINSILIIDLPEEQTTPSPEPYYYLLSIDRVIDISVNKQDEIEYIVFNTKNDRIAAFDSTFYRLFRKENDEYFLINEVPHNLGFTPAKFFWDKKLKKNNRVQRKSPITKSLGQLDRLLFWDTSIEYYESYGVFPIYWGYEKECTYKDGDNNSCDGGFINTCTYDTITGQPQNFAKACPACEKRALVGAGTFIEVPAPKDKTDSDLRDPVGMISVDVNALNFTKERLQSRKDEIFKYCVGGGGEPDNNQAQNEKQVIGNFESRQDVLMKIKEGFEKIQSFALDTLALLRYGDKFIKGVVNYGDRFYLQTVEELNFEYEFAKKNKMPNFEVSISRDLLIDTKHRNNPELRERKRILSHLEPFPDYSIQELIDLYQKEPLLIKVEDLLLKLHFDSFIKKFEREQINILMFGSRNITFKQKIDLIKSKLYEYANETRGNIKPVRGLEVTTNGDA